MRRLIIATKNAGKVKEIRRLLDGYEYEVLSLEDIDLNLDVEETGSCFEENSLLKARAIQKLTGGMVIADDSGLEIDFLNGAPGIYSSRFLGNTSERRQYEGVLALMEGVPDEYRTARFRCAASLVTAAYEMVFSGTLEGKIAFKPKGDNGFGYDPVFFIPEYKKTMAQLDSETKNRISHRGKAFELLTAKLKNWSET
ncbi:MAG: XTP/dITP diphosphatase [Clostridiaceae bacterium]|jgi:XTP/dITP diphosphohydrolase|nr:XTP/dITP diphosphatase [Clostridiaceae bacterium]